MDLNIGYLYKEHLNLYGDTGNVEILKKRAERRGFHVNVIEVDTSTSASSVFKDLNLVFMGGGPDSGQKQMYEDLLKSKGPYLKEYIEGNGVGLFICGSYQLFGRYYKSADGTMLGGLGVYDLYTEHFGNSSPRCMGNVLASISPLLTSDPVFKAVNKVDNYLVGFENHGGRTFLGENTVPLAQVVFGNGNNSVDKTEGVFYKSTIGSYLHGPILSRNPHLADYLIAKALGVEYLEELDDSLIIAAHNCSRKLKP